MFLMRKHGNIFLGRNSVEEIKNILDSYKKPLLLLSPSSNSNGFLMETKKLFSEIMIKDTGEPTSEYINNFINRINKKYDVIVAIGGGSLIDFAKVIAVMINNKDKETKQLYGISKRNKAVDIIAVPTTAGTGTEVTGVSVVIDSESKLKYGVLGDDIIPKYAILDPNLSLNLNARFTVSTGVDALTHALEAFCSRKANIMTDIYAAEAIRIIWNSLPKLKHNLKDVSLREEMLYASMLAGLSFGTAGTGAVHGFAHIIGGKYKISHGEANSIFLAPVMWYNFKYNKNKLSDLFETMGYKIVDADGFSNKIKEFLLSVDAPVTFSDVGVVNISSKDIFNSMPAQRRLFAKTEHTFTFEDVDKIISSL